MPPKDDVRSQSDKGISAIVLAESYEPRFAALETSLGLLPVCGVAAIELTLQWVSRCDISSLVLVVNKYNAEEYKKIASLWRCAFDSFQLVLCQSAQSIGDALREVEGRNAVTGTFLLIPSPISFANCTLHASLASFKERFRKDKSNVLTLIYRETRRKSTAVAVDEKGRLIAYHSLQDPSQLDSPQISDGNGISIVKEVVDTGISIGSLQALTHFSDNFDFQSTDEVIRHILVNEEVMGQHIHVSLLQPHEIACSVSDYGGVCDGISALICRWFFPLIPFRRDVTLSYSKGNILHVEGAKRLNVDGWNAYIGRAVHVEEKAKIVLSSVADNAVLGGGSVICNSFVGEKVHVGAGVRVENSFLSHDVRIDEGAVIPPFTVIAPNVHVRAAFSIPPNALLSTKPPHEDIAEQVVVTKLGEGVFCSVCRGAALWWEGEWTGNGEDEDDDPLLQATAEGDDDNAQYDDTKQFSDEIKDSMSSAFAREQSISKDIIQKLIVEINSSKLAYNIDMTKVGSQVFFTFMLLKHDGKFSSFNESYKKWKDLFTNYYSTKQPQIGLLIGLSEFCRANWESTHKLLAKIIHTLYNEDILSEDAILEWHEDLGEKDAIRPLVKELVEWLEEEDEEEEEDEGESEEDV